MYNIKIFNIIIQAKNKMSASNGKWVWGTPTCFYN